jgi:hypothetical protein
VAIVSLLEEASGDKHLDWKIVRGKRVKQGAPTLAGTTELESLDHFSRDAAVLDYLPRGDSA